MKKEIVLPIFEKLQMSLHKNYAAEFRFREGSKKLIIVFSPTAKFNLWKYELHENILFLADKKLNYYMLNPGRQTKLIYNFVVSTGFSSVVFLGSSKGGTGALLWSSLFSKVSGGSNIATSCLAFSPQTLIYPYNDHIKFPSYQGMFSTLNNNESLKICLSQYGELQKFVDGNKVITVIIYSSNYSVDKKEAERISGKNVIHISIPLSFHGAITPFLIDRNDLNSIRKISSKLFINSVNDEDLKASLPSDSDELFDMLDSIRVTSLNKLIEVFS